MSWEDLGASLGVAAVLDGPPLEGSPSDRSGLHTRALEGPNGKLAGDLRLLCSHWHRPRESVPPGSSEAMGQ